jgi:hypothetical protein
LPIGDALVMGAVRVALQLQFSIGVSVGERK